MRVSVSIRKFLLVNLLLTITLTNTLAAFGNYYLNQQEIEYHLDMLLNQSTYAIGALLSDANMLRTRDLAQIQQALDEVPQKSKMAFLMLDKEYRDHIHEYKTKYQFQVWDKQGKLLLRSADSPTTSLSDSKTGFSTKNIDGTPWRIFSTINEKLGITIVVAERYDLRNELAHQITEDDIYILLLTSLLAGFLIWVVIGRSLISVKRVAHEVAHRVPTYLEPVEIEPVPVEIKPLVDELNRLFLRLQLAFEREKRFAGDAAHELRTPLAALKTQAQVALKAPTDAERTAILHTLINAVDRCAHVVQQLLTLSQLVPEANVMNDLTEVHLPKLAAEIIAQIAPIALDKKTDIELTAKPEEIIITGNNTALGILIRNLTDNAIRYTPEGGKVQVKIEEHGEQVELSVIDNGPGIAPELRARVFERFYRVLGTKEKGSGLGLAIVQQIAKLHNGEVKLGSPTIGTGLEIKVTFPKVLGGL